MCLRVFGRKVGSIGICSQLCAYTKGSNEVIKYSQGELTLVRRELHSIAIIWFTIGWNDFEQC